MNEIPGWKSAITKSLEERDAVEKTSANDVFAGLETMYERLRQAESDYSKLQTTDAQGELQSLMSKNEELQTQLRAAKKELQENEKSSGTLSLENSKLKRENASLTKAVTKLTNKINTQTEEYQHKNKSIELVNDEIVSLSIQNNLLTDKTIKLEKENADLVQRWIDKVKSDADKMNETNAFLESYGRSKSP